MKKNQLICQAKNIQFLGSHSFLKLHGSIYKHREKRTKTNSETKIQAQLLCAASKNAF